MNEISENVWRKGLIWGVLLYGSFGLVMMILILVLPESFYQGAWNDPLIAGMSKRVALFGGGLAIVWALLLLQQTSPLMIMIDALGGMLLWSLGEFHVIIPLAICIPLSFAIAWSATRDLLKQVDKFKSYASKVDSTGNERNQIIQELFEAIVNSRSDILRTTAAQTAKLFGKDGMKPLLKNREYPHPKARQRIAYALDVIGDKEAIPELQTLADKEEDSAVKRTALDAIGEISVPISYKGDKLKPTCEGENHQWEGCKCQVCGATRNQNHAWVACKCTCCEMIRDTNHQYSAGRCWHCGQKKMIKLKYTPRFHPKEDVMRSRRRWQVGTLVVSLLLVFLILALFLASYWSKDLFPAIVANDIQEVERLIEKGAEVNKKDKDGATPLAHAALNGYYRIAELLIANGADVDARDNQNASPLFYAAAKGYAAAAKILIENGANVNLLCGGGVETSARPLHMAAGSGNVQLVKMLIVEGADVNGRAQNGWTPLFTAAAKGHSSIVKALLAGGADVNAKDMNGGTALSVAVIMGHTDIVKLLQNKGAEEAFSQQAIKEKQLRNANYAIRAAKYQEAISILNKYLKREPKQSFGWILKAEAKTRLNKYHEAIESVNKAISVDKESIPAITSKANILNLMGKEAEAQDLVKKVITMTPSSAYDFLARGAAFKVLSQFDNALADYNRALVIDPTLAEALMNKGMVYWYKREYEKAIQPLTAALKIDPNYVEALTNRGASYRKMGNIDKAISDYSRAIGLNPNDAMTFYNRGVAYQKRRLHEKVIQDFTSAIRLQPHYPEAYLNRGVAYMSINKLAEAKKDFNKAVEQDPTGVAGQRARKGLEILKKHLNPLVSPSI